jgi:hypothetical protein
MSVLPRNQQYMGAVTLIIGCVMRRRNEDRDEEKG